MVATIVMFYTLTDVPRPETLPLPQVATIQYADGSTLARIGSVDRTIVHLEQVPKHVRWAVLAAEDRSFYSEPGVSIRGTLRAALSDVTGGDTQGGSGITQQYVKNAYLSNAQTLSRKLKELMIAVKLSREYTKDQILEFYLNTVYFGRDAYGIEAAAQAYFGEHVEQLTTAQGALLAGLLRAPGYYDPAANPDQAQAPVALRPRRHGQDRAPDPGAGGRAEVPEDAEAARHRPGDHGLEVPARQRGARRSRTARHLGRTRSTPSGLTIRTTIDRKAQSAALKAIQHHLRAPDEAAAQPEERAGRGQSVQTAACWPTTAAPGRA